MNRQISADIATVRASLFDVIDAGWQCDSKCDLKHPWAFPTEMFPGDQAPSDRAIQLRTKFVDQVIDRIVELHEKGL